MIISRLIGIIDNLLQPTCLFIILLFCQFVFILWVTTILTDVHTDLINIFMQLLDDKIKKALHDCEFVFILNDCLIFYYY